ncbi:MAG TPA: copper resistance protein B [Azospirillaceae bacterium]|nr:copper resistance protein B [Azospirillaceae bacterium]
MRRTVLAAAIAAGVFAPAAFPKGAGAQSMMDDHWYHQVLVDQLEYRARDGNDAVAWDAQAWIGGDYNRLLLRTEGEWVRHEGVESAEVQALYSRLVGYFWDAHAGIRYDIRPDPSRAYAVIGVQGLAPYYFEVGAQAFVSNEGDVSARFEAEYDLLITQNLILQPAAELNVALQRVTDIGVGRGINDLELGLRLRYEFTREFAPYVGVLWERKFGETADLARDEGEDTDSLSFVAGIRFWF